MKLLVQSQVSINHITPNPFQPRLDFEKQPLLELAESIKEHGIIQPITVRKIGRNEFQIISGERRFQAAKLALIENYLVYKIADDQHMLEMAIVENTSKKGLKRHGNCVKLSTSNR